MKDFFKKTGSGKSKKENDTTEDPSNSSPEDYSFSAVRSDGKIVLNFSRDCSYNDILEILTNLISLIAKDSRAELLKLALESLDEIESKKKNTELVH